jgi:hypothetical protein
MLEHPAEAFAYFRSQGAPHVICEQKHMGSRAVVVVCADDQAAKACFGIAGDEFGIVYTRTGRRFFNDSHLERQLLDRVRSALTASGFWQKFQTKWVCLDCELMPWSAKAQELLRSQYAAVGSAGRGALPRAVAALRKAAARLGEVHRPQLNAIMDEYRQRDDSTAKFITAYRQYCWPVSSLSDLKLAPFHLLATEGRVHVDKDHDWHMEELAKICRCDPDLLLATSFRTLDVTDPSSEARGIDWWTELTDRGGEGMVVKPLSFVWRGNRGLAQPAVKCRGREYLRLIYGPDYTAEQNLARLRNRAVGQKRALAISEFALGIEGLERFVRGEPLRRVHECVFAVLALESEPVDLRL